MSLHEVQPLEFSIRISYLADYPDLIADLARWHQDEWGDVSPYQTVDAHIAKLQGRLGRRGIPTTLIALSGNTLLASANLVEHDMANRLDLSPWLASVYVVPQHRGQGIGTAFIRRSIEETRELGFKKLYLYTLDRPQFYARFGWAVRERSEYRGMNVVLMELELGV